VLAALAVLGVRCWVLAYSSQTGEQFARTQHPEPFFSSTLLQNVRRLPSWNARGPPVPKMFGVLCVAWPKFGAFSTSL